LGQSGCAPLADLQRFVNDTNDTCVTPDNAVIDLVARSPQITRVILSFNGTVMANGTGTSGGYEVMELAGTLLPPDESIRVALERTARRFLEAGKSVWLILQVPEMEFQIQECFARPFSFEHRVLTPCATPLAHVVAREAKYRQIVKEAQMNVPALQVFDPRPVLCDTEWCYAMRDRQLLYVDNNHLSREGSQLFRDRFGF